jgi:hypothetical protein
MSSIPWPDIALSCWRSWLRIVTQDCTLIEVQLRPVRGKAAWDVLVVSRLWNNPPVQGT